MLSWKFTTIYPAYIALPCRCKNLVFPSHRKKKNLQKTPPFKHLKNAFSPLPCICDSTCLVFRILALLVPNPLLTNSFPFHPRGCCPKSRSLYNCLLPYLSVHQLSCMQDQGQTIINFHDHSSSTPHGQTVCH